MKQRILKNLSRALPILRRVTSGLLAFVFCAYLVFDILPVDAKAMPGDTGVIGEISWEIDSTGETITFSGTGALKEPTVYGGEENENYWQNVYGIVNTKKIVIEEGITSLSGDFLFPSRWFQLVKEVVLPSSLKSIGAEVFEDGTDLNYNKSIESISIPETGLKAIGEYAFYYLSSLKNFGIPKSVTSIGPYAFKHCDNLETPLVIPDGVLTIEEQTFYECSSIPSLTLNNKIECIGDLSFYECDSIDGSISIPASVTSIGRYAFYGCNSLDEVYYYAACVPEESAFMGLSPDSKIYTLDKSLFTDQYNYDSNTTQLVGLYKATFVDHDGTILKEEYVEEGNTPTPPADPSRAADKTYKYAFTGWSNSTSTPMNSNVLFTAQYAQSYVDYVVKYTRDDGTLIKEDTHHYGEALTVPSAPTKDADNTYTYTFSKWKTTPPAKCTGNATYVAQFTKTYRDYTVIFKDYDGSVISTKKYHYGDSVVVPEDPARPSDGYNTYVFAGWDSPVVAVAGNKTYTAVYRSTAEKYTVTFKDYDGTVISSGEYFYGDAITPPQDPVRTSDDYADYIFRGWSLVPEAVKKDATYTAQYIVIPKSYTVMFYNHDGRLLHLGSYHYGDAVYQPTVTSVPESENEKAYIYTFAGWGESFSEICSGSATYEAVFEKDYVEYDITFRDYDGSILSTQTCHYGDAITAPAVPTRSADNTYMYTFAGWDKAVADTVTEDVTYTAQYSATYIEYEVIFKNFDGSTISEQMYHYGDSLIVPPNPTRPNEGATGYAFSQWSPTLSPTVTSDAVYRAEYTTGTAEYTVSFIDWDTYVLSSDTYLWRDLVAMPPSPYRLDDDTYSYQFIGWSPGVEYCVSSNMTYIAQYEKKYREYAVRFENYDGSVISQTLYHYGDAVQLPSYTPYRLSDDTYAYTFTGWDRDVLPTCTGSETYIAQFGKTPIMYMVTFQDHDGTILYLKADCTYGDAITPPAEPTRAVDNKYSYTFAGWDKAVADTVTGSVIYTATYTATPLLDTDGDGIPDVYDDDDDNDGIPDSEDPNPLVKDIIRPEAPPMEEPPAKEELPIGSSSENSSISVPLLDTDGDGIPDILDDDDDNDGIPDSEDANPLVKDIIEPETPPVEEEESAPESSENLPTDEKESEQIVTEETSHSSETPRPSARPSSTASGKSPVAPPTEIGTMKDITVTFLDYYGNAARRVNLSGRTLDEPITDDVAAPPLVDNLVFDNDRTYVFTGWEMRIGKDKNVVFVSQYEPFVKVEHLSAMVDIPSTDVAEDTSGELIDLRIIGAVGGMVLLLSAGATYMFLIRKQNNK